MTEQRIPTFKNATVDRMRLSSETSQYLLLVVLAVMLRLVPHPPNVTAIGALGLLAGARGQSAMGWIVPVLALLLTDLWIGGYAPFSMLFVYGGFAAGAGIGRWWLGRRAQFRQTVVASMLMSTTFYLMSNFGWWLAGSDYALTSDGLLTCYIAALPWFVTSILGDLFYSLLLIGSYDCWVGSRKALGLQPNWVSNDC